MSSRIYSDSSKVSVSEQYKRITCVKPEVPNMLT